jgi:hypothetical protein
MPELFLDSGLLCRYLFQMERKAVIVEILRGRECSDKHTGALTRVTQVVKYSTQGSNPRIITTIRKHGVFPGALDNSLLKIRQVVRSAEGWTGPGHKVADRRPG